MSSPLSWAAFARETPEMAAGGRRLLGGADGLPIAFLATGSPTGAPRLSPVCPIFCGDELYLSAAARTPKARDLKERGDYALHAFLGENDEEFQVGGVASVVEEEAERAEVHAAIPFQGFDRADPIFRFGITRALWVHWERVGHPDTRPVRRRWRAA